MHIGFLGGTGDQGRGLALRLAAAGHDVMLGSRAAERAEAAAGELQSLMPAVAGRIGAGTNDEVALACDPVVVAVPYDGHAALLQTLAAPLSGRLVIDCVNPLGFDDRGPHPLAVPDGSAAQEAARLLPGSTVVAAFHHVSAVLLLDVATERVDTDVLVLGDDRGATDTVIGLADAIPGMRGIYAGRLRNAGQVEALTANLIAINRRYKTHAGVRITGVAKPVQS